MNGTSGVSAVVAAWPDLRGLERCLTAVRPQLQSPDEILVASSLPPPATFEPGAPGVRWVPCRPGALIPQLWSAGLDQAHNPVVAFTTAHFLPAADWLATARDAPARLGVAAVGGRIDPPRHPDAVAWATWFTRYSAYLGLEREQDLEDLAGDNAAYARTALEPHAAFLRSGFWEHGLNQRLRAAGARLRYLPELAVRLELSFGFSGFLAQRFQHGYQFGAARAGAQGPARRALGLVAAPLVPGLLLGRIAARVLRAGRYRVALLATLPLVAAFIAAWSLGEAVGGLRGPERETGS